MMELFKLRDGGLLFSIQRFIEPDVADRYFEELRATIAWTQKPARFGRLQPRLSAAHGDPGVTYRYSGIENSASPWTETLLEIKRLIETIQGKYNYCLLNRYRSGADSVSWHADDEPGVGSMISSMSLGASRTFRLRHNTTRETMAFTLEHGSLIIMAGTLQQFWKHEIPKTKSAIGERINLTFRQISASGERTAT